MSWENEDYAVANYEAIPAPVINTQRPWMQNVAAFAATSKDPLSRLPSAVQTEVLKALSGRKITNKTSTPRNLLKYVKGRRNFSKNIEAAAANMSRRINTRKWHNRANREIAEMVAFMNAAQQQQQQQQLQAPLPVNNGFAERIRIGTTLPTAQELQEEAAMRAYNAKLKSRVRRGKLPVKKTRKNRR